MSNWSNTLNGPILMATGSATGSSDGKAMIFAKSDGKIYVKDSSGTEAAVGSSGGESSGATRTNYDVTMQDLENSAFLTAYLAEFTVPANTWLDGESVTLIYTFDRLQNRGSSNNLDFGIYFPGVISGVVSTGIDNSATIYRVISYITFRRDGNDVWFYRNNNGGGPNVNPYSISFTDLATTGTGTTMFNKSRFAVGTPTWSSDITISLYAYWYHASPSSYIRGVNATAFKDSKGNMI